METQLTKENIQLIRDFLQKNGVAHTDILQELTDHVASACEVLMKEQNQSFLTVFVPYMRVNGAVLIDKAYPLFDFSMVKSFIKFCKNKYFFAGLGLLIPFYFNFLWEVVLDVFTLYVSSMVVLVIVSLIQSGCFRWVLRKKLYKIERLQIVMMLFMYGFLLAESLHPPYQNLFGFINLYIGLWMIAFVYQTSVKVIAQEKIWL